MTVLIIREKATKEQIQKMLETLGNYIKVAVDISKGVLAGGGILHADCESVLIQDGSKQEDIWGADWFPENGKIRFEAMINIAPRRKNRSMEIQDQTIRNKVVDVIQTLLGDK